MSLADKIVLVTGATGGLGEAITRRLAADGALVLAHYRRSEAPAAELAASIQDSGGRAEPIGFDIRDGTAVTAAIRSITDTHGRLDGVVNNAGVVLDGPFAVMDEAAWTEVVQTNLTGTFLVCRAAARAMLAKRSGFLLNVSSVAGLRASPFQANYSAAKAGMLGLTRTLARELGPKGIRVNAVIPGLIAAGMGARVDRRHARAVVERVPLGRAGTAEEVAAAVAFLASDEAAYVHGAELTVDGGLTV